MTEKKVYEEVSIEIVDLIKCEIITSSSPFVGSDDGLFS